MAESLVLAILLSTRFVVSIPATVHGVLGRQRSGRRQANGAQRNNVKAALPLRLRLHLYLPTGTAHDSFRRGRLTADAGEETAAGAARTRGGGGLVHAPRALFMRRGRIGHLAR